MTMPVRDNAADRAIGQHWENQFCAMARLGGKFFTPHQFGRPTEPALFHGTDSFGKTQWTLPDITIWSAPDEHHEIKHKNPTKDGMYGLERYRLDALVRFANVTGQSVYYTIHDWEMAGADGAGDPVSNDISHWLVGEIGQLSHGCTRQGPGWTYYNGEMKKMPMWFWTADTSRKYRYFRPLAEVWEI